jgi:hypothetical protein
MMKQGGQMKKLGQGGWIIAVAQGSGWAATWKVAK